MRCEIENAHRAVGPVLSRQGSIYSRLNSVHETPWRYHTVDTVLCGLVCKTIYAYYNILWPTSVVSKHQIPNETDTRTVQKFYYDSGTLHPETSPI